MFRKILEKIKSVKISLQTMQAFALYFLLVAVHVPTFIAMPEPISEDWDHPLSPPSASTPPPPPYPPMDGPARFYPNGENMTEPPAGDLEAYCQMLLQGPVPLPPDQVPWFCLCTHCQSSQGPKGDRGDRGLPGKCCSYVRGQRSIE